MPLPASDNLVVVGDLHADVGALMAALRPWTRQSKRVGNLVWKSDVPPGTVVVFCGDFLDRKRPGSVGRSKVGPPLTQPVWHGAGEIPGGWEEALVLDVINDLACQGDKRGIVVVKVVGNHDLWSALPSQPYSADYASDAAVAFAEQSRVGVGSKVRAGNGRIGRVGLAWTVDSRGRNPTCGEDDHLPVVRLTSEMANPRCRRWMLVCGGGLGQRLACGTCCAVAVVGDWIFCHGGLTPEVLGCVKTVEELLRRANGCVQRVLSRGEYTDHDFNETFAPLWTNRDLSEGRVEPATLQRLLKALAEKPDFNVAPKSVRFAVGHTPQFLADDGEQPDAQGMFGDGASRSFCGVTHGEACNSITRSGPVYRVDVGMSRAFAFTEAQAQRRTAACLHVRKGHGPVVITSVFGEAIDEEREDSEWVSSVSKFKDRDGKSRLKRHQ